MHTGGVLQARAAAHKDAALAQAIAAFAGGAAALGVLLAPARADAVTPAGARIVNIAGATFAQGGASAEVGSNPATLAVLEVLGVTLQRIGDGPVHAGVGHVTAVPFVLTNVGNGHEAFVLSGAITGLDAQVSGFAIDRDGDGRYEPATDTAIAQGAATPPLDAGGGLRLLALVQSDAAEGEGTLTLSAHAITGSGRPGTSFPGAGDGGSDAIVGQTGAAASLDVPVAGAADAVTATLVKSQVVLAPDGTDRPTHGAIVTYTIEARFDGASAATSAVLTDPIPEGADYVPGSLRLNAAPLTDADGDDAGSYVGNAVQVTLGDVIAPATRTISFQTKIQ